MVKKRGNPWVSIVELKKHLGLPWYPIDGGMSMRERDGLKE